MAGIKIVDLPPLGRDLASTDLLELSLAGGTGSRKITGQEIMNASKLSINNTPIINGTVGRVLFQGTGDVLQQSSSLFWDNTNGRLGIGTSSPTHAVTIENVAQPSVRLVDTTNAAYLDLNIGNFDATISSNGRIYINSTTTFSANATNVGVGIANPINAKFQVVGTVLFSSGNVIMNSTSGNTLIGTTTDAGFKLDVNGATRIKGTGTTSSTTAFTVQNSAGTTYFSIKDDGALSSSGTDTGIYSNFTTGNKSPLLFSHSGYGTNTPNDTRIDFGYRGRQAGGLNSYDFFTYKVYQGADPTVTTGFEFYTHQNQTSSLASQLAMAINGSNVGIGTSSPANKLDIKGTGDVVLIDSNAVASRVTLKLNTTSASYTQIIGNGTELNLATLGSTHITFATNSSERVRIGSTTGNVLINTTTDAGYRLDVNGTARVSGNITATTIGFANTSRTITFDDAFSGLQYQGFGGHRFKVYNSSTALYQEMLTMVGNQSNLRIGINSATPNASAILDVVSTDKGFLPPRMTQAQRNAIASPAIGLEIYQTDATEGKYIYKSSGWTYIG